MEYSEYELRFVTIAPVFIGGGEKRSAKEYIKIGNEFFFPKMDDFIRKIIEKSGQTYLYQAFIKFMADPRKRLTTFCKEMNISIDELSGYTMKAPFGSKNGELNDILQFNRDPYEKIFIPGSSIKGMVRTILENTALKDKDCDKNKFFSHLIVRDSTLIIDDNLVLTQKWDLSCKPYAKPKPLPIFREAIKPRCLFTCKVKVTENQDGIVEMVNSLAELSRDYYQQYINYFLKDFPNNYVQNIKLNSNVGICYLGGGSGFWSKVVINEDAKREIRKKRNVKHNGALKLTKFPAISKLGVANSDGFYEMGKCIFEVKKMRG